jgi:hypothetical protein
MSAAAALRAALTESTASDHAHGPGSHGLSGSTKPWSRSGSLDDTHSARHSTPVPGTGPREGVTSATGVTPHGPGGHSFSQGAAGVSPVALGRTSSASGAGFIQMLGQGSSEQYLPVHTTADGGHTKAVPRLHVSTGGSLHGSRANGSTGGGTAGVHSAPSNATHSFTTGQRVWGQATSCSSTLAASLATTPRVVPLPEADGYTSAPGATGFDDGLSDAEGDAETLPSLHLLGVTTGMEFGRPHHARGHQVAAHPRDNSPPPVAVLPWQAIPQGLLSTAGSTHSGTTQPLETGSRHPLLGSSPSGRDSGKSRAGSRGSHLSHLRPASSEISRPVLQHAASMPAASPTHTRLHQTTLPWTHDPQAQ